MTRSNNNRSNSNGRKRRNAFNRRAFKRWQQGRSPVDERALFKAAEEGLDDLVIDMIESAEYDVNSRDGMDKTPFLICVSKGHYNLAFKLVEMGADIHTTDSRGNTALHLLARSNVPATLKEFLALGYEVDVRNGGKQTPLMWAAHSGYPDMVKVFMKAGANPNLADLDGDNALLRAASSVSPECISVLLQGGANIRSINENNDTVDNLLFAPPKKYREEKRQRALSIVDEHRNSQKKKRQFVDLLQSTEQPEDSYHAFIWSLAQKKGGILWPKDICFTDLQKDLGYGICALDIIKFTRAERRVFSSLNQKSEAAFVSDFFNKGLYPWQKKQFQKGYNELMSRIRLEELKQFKSKTGPLKRRPK